MIIPLSDGTQIAAYRYQPKSAKPTGITFIATHGFINTALATDDVLLATTLVTAGHQVISYDTRSHGNSTTMKYAHYTPDYFPKAMLDDTLAIIDYIKKMPEVNAKKLGFIGFSYGGIIALTGAIRDPDISCVIAGCAVHNYNQLWHHHLHSKSWMERYSTQEIFFHRQKYSDFYEVFEQQPFGVPDENILVFDTGGHKFSGHYEDVKNKILEWIASAFKSKKL